MKLKSSTGAETIGDGEESAVFFVGHGVWSVYLAGDASAATLTLKSCRRKDGTFLTYKPDVSGTATAQSFSATHVADTSSMFQRSYVGGGMYFKFVDDGAGTDTSWQIDVNGNNVHPVPST